MKRVGYAILLALLSIGEPGGATGTAKAQQGTAADGSAVMTRLPAIVDQRFSEVEQQLDAQRQEIAAQQRRIDDLERALRERAPAPGITRPSIVPAGMHDGRKLSAPDVATSESNAAIFPEAEFAPSVRPCADGCAGPLFTVGGQYRVMFNAANFDFHQAAISDEQSSQSFLNQRFRTWLTVATSESVEAYVQAEMGHIAWGVDREFPKAFTGPRFPPSGDDRVGVELRRGYLTYKPDAESRARLGIQDWQDAFGQTLASSDWDFNVGGLSWDSTVAVLGDAHILAGAFVLWEGEVQDADDALLFTLDLDWSMSPDSGWGLSCYFLPDHDQHSYPTAAAYDAAYDFWLGLRAKSVWNSLPVNGFVLYNPGWRKELAPADDLEHHGFAVKLEAGPWLALAGRWSAQALYSNEEFRTIAQSARDDFGAQGYWSYLAITSPHGPSDVNDLGVSLQNRSLGLFTVQGKFEYEVTERLIGVLAAGWLQSASSNPASQSSDMGTELMKMFTYDFGGGLKMDLGAAVLFTGDFYKPSPIAPAPDALWEAFSRVQLEF